MHTCRPYHIMKTSSKTSECVTKVNHWIVIPEPILELSCNCNCDVANKDGCKVLWNRGNEKNIASGVNMYHWWFQSLYLKSLLALHEIPPTDHKPQLLTVFASHSLSYSLATPRIQQVQQHPCSNTVAFSQIHSSQWSTCGPLCVHQVKVNFESSL